MLNVKVWREYSESILGHIRFYKDVKSDVQIYTKQLSNCDELKQAFLKKAFEEEL